MIDKGGQGTVWRAEAPSLGGPVALKWYRPAVATVEQWADLTYLISRPSPSPAFVWPLDLARAEGDEAFGYAMPLMPEDFRTVADLVRGETESGGPVERDFRIIINVCFRFVRALQTLHAAGLCYRDISAGNLFYRPADGEILVCDNDNVGIDLTTARVWGTPRYMAPEIVRGEALPSSRTDLHSLAVMLFSLLMRGHPFEGRATQGFEGWEHVRVYGRYPLFCFDPDDDSNAVDPGSQTAGHWILYPSSLRRLFLKAFTSGIHDPVHGRVRESEWVHALVQLRNAVLRCSACRNVLFWDPEEPDRSCYYCDARVAAPLVLTIKGRDVVVGPDLSLDTAHLDLGYDHAQALASATLHPDDPRRVGLTNESTQTWSATLPDGVHHQVRPGRTIALDEGLEIDFPLATGVVRRAAGRP